MKGGLAIKKRNSFMEFIIAALFVVPMAAGGEGYGADVPPVGQPLISEGMMALQLVEVLQIGQAQDEAEAESMLGELGIEPKNGWIAGYPVTPDIIVEIKKSVASAAGANKLKMGKEEAEERVENMVAELGLNIYPSTSSPTAQEVTVKGQQADLPAEEVDNYYSAYGPPVVTYYPPPEPYGLLYAWVAFPFRCRGFSFNGFFVLHDFHRYVIFHKRRHLITNHFVDGKTRKVFVIDPVSRNSGRGVEISTPSSVPPGRIFIIPSPAVRGSFNGFHGGGGFTGRGGFSGGGSVGHR